jgi:autotransporter-associated beta strand protein
MVSAVLAGGSATKTTAGTLVLSGANTFVGGFTLGAGSVRAGDDAAFGIGMVTLNGGVLSSTDTHARAFANALTLGGDVTFGDTTNNGALSFAGLIDLGATTRTLTVASDLTFDGVVSGAAGLTKDGAGTLTFTAANTYAGATTVNGGTLVAAAGSLAATTSIDIGVATLTAVDANAAAALTVAAGGSASFSGSTVAVASLAGAGDVQLGATTLKVGAGNFSGVISGANASLVKDTAGTLTLSGVNTYAGSTSVDAGTLFTVGHNRLANTSGVTVGSGATLDLGGDETLGTLANAGTIALSAVGSTLTVTSGTSSGAINGDGSLTKVGPGSLALTGANAFTGATTISGGTVTASAGALGGTSAVSIGAAATLDAVDVNNPATLGVAATGTGSFSAAGLTVGAVSNEGTLNFTALTGRITLTSLAGLGTTNFSSDALISGGISGGIVNVAGNLNSTISGGIVTTFSLDTTSVTGGVVTVTGANTATGGTNTVSGGTIRLGDDAAVATGGLVVTGPATFTSESSATRSVSSDVTLGGDITIGDLTYDGTLNFTGEIDLGLATREITTVADATFAGNISGQGGLNKTGTGTLTLSGTGNTFSGTTDVNAGTLATTGNNVLSSTAGITIANGATVQLGGNETLSSINNSGTLQLDATLTAAITTGTSTLGGLVSGNGILVKDGAGTLVVDGANTYSGGTTVNAGTLQVGHATALGTAGVSLNAGTFAASSSTGVALANDFMVAGDVTLGDATNAGALTLSGTVTLGTARTLTTAADVTLSGAVSVAGLTKEGSAALHLSGASTISGDVVVNAGTLATGTATTLGAVSSVTVATGATLKLNGAETVTALTNDGSILLNSGSLTTGDNSDRTISGSIDGTGALVKSGTGILTLNGASTFAGTTTLDAGTLNLTSAGALGTSAVTVNAGTLVANANLGNAINLLAGSLQGSGIVGATNIAAGAILSPGNSPGTLTHASLTLTGGSIIEWQITDALAAGISKTDSALVAGSAYDTLAITGALDISGASAANPITVRVVSLANPTDLTPGDANNFDTMMVNRFKFAEVGSLVTNATPFADLFTYDLSGFTDSDGAVSEVDLWAMSFESNVLWLTAVPQLLSYGILAPGNAPGFLTLADLNLTGRATFEISKLPQIGGYYNDTVEFTGKANLNPTGIGEIAIARYEPAGEMPDYGRRFVLFKGVGTPVTDPTLVSSYFTNPTPWSVVNLDPEARYLVVGPAAIDPGATPSAYDGQIRNADGLVHRPNEYAVYLVRGAAGYVKPTVGAGLTGYVQSKALTLSGQPLELGGSAYVPGALDPLVAQLMTMADPMLESAMRGLEPASFAAVPGTLALAQRTVANSLHRELAGHHSLKDGSCACCDCFHPYSEGFVLVNTSRFVGGAGAEAADFSSRADGVMGGLMKRTSRHASYGFALGHDTTNGTLGGGGTIEGNTMHATLFATSLLGEKTGTPYLNVGATLARTDSETARTTFLGTQRAQPKAQSLGGFARIGADYGLKQGFTLSPYAGLDFVHVDGDAFTETGDLSALDVRGYSYDSTRATIGTNFGWSTAGIASSFKFSIELEAFTELGSQTAEFDASFGSGDRFLTEGRVNQGAGFRVAPSFIYQPDRTSSYYLTLSLEKAGETKTEGFEVGYRRRF